jgi:hypothetical protein
MTQEELNKRYARKRKGFGISITVPEHIKKIRMLERIADAYKMDKY